jgi:outer membrane protein OmpA-like peptidoglycan-associated protein
MSGLNVFSGMKGFVFSGLEYGLVSGTFSYIGGAGMRIENSVTAFRISSAVFRNIVSTAILVLDSEVSLGAELVNSVYDFRGNGADIWLMGSGSRLEFNVEGGKRQNFINGLRVRNSDLAGGSVWGPAANDFKTVKRGGGIAIFAGQTTSIEGGFRIEAGSAVFNSRDISVDRLEVGAGGAISFFGAGLNTFYVGSAQIDGAWELDIDFSQRSADTIISSELLGLSSDAQLIIRNIGQGGRVFGSSVVIAIANGALNYQEPFYDSSKYMLAAIDGKIYVMNVGEIPNFKYLTQTHNQEEALGFLEKVVSADRRGGSFYRSGGSGRTEKVFLATSLIGELISLESADKMRRALDMLSGQFLAQTITRAAMNNPGEHIYPHIKRVLVSGLQDNKDDGKSLFFHSLWVSGSARQNTMDGPKYNLGTFEQERYDGMIGFNILERADKAAGAYASFGTEYIKQGSNEAVFENFEGGLYGGLFLGRFEQKGFLGGGWHNVETKRDIDLLGGLRPEARFYLASIKAGVESAYDVTPAKNTPIKTSLFGGVNASVVYNRDIKEDGEGILNLTVREGNYGRTLGFGGLRFKGKQWYADARMNYLLFGSGSKSRFNFEWNEFNHSMEIEGAPDDLVSFTVAFGFEQEIEKDIYFFGGADATRSRGGYEHSFGGRVGLKYVFPTLTSFKGYRNWLTKTNPERQRIAREKKEARELKRRAQEAERELERSRREALSEQKKSAKLAEIERLERERKAAQPRMTLLSDQSDMDLAVEMPPDVAEEERINRRSKVERIVAHVVVVKKTEGLGATQGHAHWETLVNVDDSGFESGSGNLTAELKSDIRKSIGKVLANSSDIARVRVVRYGPEPSGEEIALAQLRASRIYDEIEKVRRESEETRAAYERRENAIASYKLKAASFALNSSVLSESAIRHIERLSKEIQEKGFKRVTVEGHTDSSGVERTNEMLSRQRASSVFAELIKTGIAKEKLQLIGFAARMPIADNATEEGRAANRRVEIFVE